MASALAVYLSGSALASASYRVRRIHRLVLTADAQYAIAVGARGTALVSRDAGATWSPIALATQLDLYGIALSADGNDGIIVGDEGLVLVTHDAGATWGMRRSETPDPLYDVSMSADGRHAVAVGWLGSVVSSHDGGTSWMLREISRREDLMRVAISPDGQRAWTSGLARDFAGPWWFTTKDGGSTWAAENAAHTDCAALDFAFDRNAQNAWLLLDVVQCNGQFVVSADGGKSWREQGELVPLTRRLFTAAATDAQHVWAGGAAGSVMATSDGGAHWTWQKTGAKGTLFSVAFADDAQRGVVASSDGKLFFTRDGGKSWKPSQLPPRPAAPGADVVDPDDVRYQEPCTVEAMARAARDATPAGARVCRRCKNYFDNSAEHCAHELPAGFVRACRTRGVTTRYEVWCGAAAADAGAPRVAPAERAAGGQHGCSGCALSAGGERESSAVLFGVLALSTWRRRGPRRRAQAARTRS